MTARPAELQRVGPVSPGEVSLSLKAHGDGKHSRLLWFEGESAADRLKQESATSPRVEPAGAATITPAEVLDLPGLQSRLTNYREARKQQIEALIAGYRSLLGRKKGADAALATLEPYATQITKVLEAESIRPLPFPPASPTNLAAEFTQLHNTFINQLTTADTQLQTQLDQSLQALATKFDREGNTADSLLVKDYHEALKARLAESGADKPTTAAATDGNEE